MVLAPNFLGLLFFQCLFFGKSTTTKL